MNKAKKTQATQKRTCCLCREIIRKGSYHYRLYQEEFDSNQRHWYHYHPECYAVMNATEFWEWHERDPKNFKRPKKTGPGR